MKITLSSFYENLENLSPEEITEYLSFFGEKVLDHSSALNQENANIIAESIPFSYPYIKKIVEDKELTELYWKNDLLKKEEIQDIEIANILAEHNLLKFSDISNSLIEKIFVQKISNELSDKYLDIFSKESLSDVLDEVKSSESYLAQKYFEYCFSNKDGSNYLLDKVTNDYNRSYKYPWVEFIPKQDLIAHVVKKIEEDSDLNLSLLLVSDIQLLIKSLKGPSKLRFLSKLILGNYSHPEFSRVNEEFVLSVLDAMPEDYLNDTLEELDAPMAKLIVSVLISNHRKVIFPKVLFSSRESDFIAELINENHKLTEEMVIDLFERLKETEQFDSVLNSTLLDEKGRSEIMVAVVTHFKEYLEENKVWYHAFSKLPYSKIIDSSKFSEEDTKHVTADSISKIKDSTEVSGHSLFSLFTLMKSEYLNEEVFDYCLDKVVSNSREMDLEPVISHLNAERQLKVFQRLDNNDKIKLIGKFDKLSQDVINESLLNWLRTDDNQSLDVSSYDTILSLIDINLIPLHQISKLVSHYSYKEDASKETVEKLLRRLESSPEVLTGTINKSSFGLIRNKLIPDDMFLKAFNEGNNHSFKKKTFESDYYFNLLSNTQKATLDAVIDDFRDIEHIDKIIQVIQESSDSSLLESKVHPNYLEEFKKRELYFKNQTIENFQDFNGEALAYILQYVKNVSFADIESLLQYPLNVKSVWHIAEPEIKNGIELKPKIVVSILETQNAEFSKIIKENIIKNKSFSSEVLEALLENNQIDSNFFLKLLSGLNHVEINSNVRSILKNALENDLCSLEKMVEIIETQDLMDVLYQTTSRDSLQMERKLVRYIRNQEKTKLLPDDYLTKLDLLDSSKSWEFYNAKIDQNYLSKMSETERKHFFNSLMNSYSEGKDVLHGGMLEFFKFDKSLLFSVLDKTKTINIRNIVSLGIEEDSLNREAILEWCSQNLEKLEQLGRIAGHPTDFFVSLYNAGIKNIFSIELENLDLEDGDVVEILNNSKDLYLLKKYENKWKEITTYSKYSKEITKELAKTVTKDDITKERISFEKGELIFAISGIEIVKAKFNKKHNKWSLISGERKDLYKNVRDLFKDLNEEYPEKIVGTVSLYSGEFEPNQEISFPIKIRSDDSAKISYMRELGMEGNIPAVAKRNSNFGYSLDINFEKNASIKDDEIKREIQKKTFDIQKKLNELLKVNPSRTFGFELELAVRYSTRGDVAAFLKKKGFNASASGSRFASKGNQWDLKEDGSLSNSYIQVYDEDSGEETEDGDVFEIASPILKGREGISEAKRFLVSLFKQFDVESGEEVNAGLHVHHDVKDILDLEKGSEEIMRSYLPFQEVLYELIDSWRNDSEYCVKIDPENIKEGRGVYNNSGATGVLLSPYGTMEFRMKEGLTNVSELLNWIIYTQNIVEAIFFKLSNKISKQKTKIEKLSEMTVYMLLENQNATYSKSKIKSIRKLVGMQEFVYAKS